MTQVGQEETGAGTPLFPHDTQCWLHSSTTLTTISLEAALFGLIHCLSLHSTVSDTRSFLELLRLPCDARR
jgi:hypothetical protein